MKIKLGLLASVAAGAILIPARVSAQVGPQPTPPSPFQTIDQNGVELQTGALTIPLASVLIGSGGPGSLGYTIFSNNTTSQQQQPAYGYVAPGNPVTPVYKVVIGGTTESFTLTGSLGSGTFSQDQGRTSTLSYSTATGQYTYTGEDGSVAIFGTQLVAGNPPSDLPKILTLTYPAGQVLTYYYVYHPYTSGGTTINAFDVQAVTSNLGYQLRFGYSLFGGVQTLSSVVVFNMLSETCNPSAPSCTLVGTWPSLTINNSAYSITDTLGRVTSVTTSGITETITYPTGRPVVYTLGASSHVTSIYDGKGTWTYQYPNPANSVTLIYNPDNAQPRQVTWSITSGLPDTDYPWGTVAGFHIHYVYDSKNRITGIQRINGTVTSETDYAYDPTSNRQTSTTVLSASGGTPSSLTISSNYVSGCPNPKTCNQPTSTVDPNGNQTDYTYDPNSGNIATITLPAPTTGAARPQTRFTYITQSANYRNGSGTIISGSPVYLLQATSQCVLRSTCSGGGNELKTTLTYDSNQALLPISSTTGPGNGIFASTTAYSYYPTGDVNTIDGPIAGTADTTRYYYDAMRQNTGVIGPRPHGGAFPPPFRAKRFTYNGEGQTTLSEAGTAAGQGDSDMSTFTSLQKQATTYDGQGRPRTISIQDPSVTYSLTQLEYTNAGSLHCSAVRMDPAFFGTLPTSACTQSIPGGPYGAFGPDRITQYGYNSAFKVTTISDGVGTVTARTAQTNSYGPLYELQTVADAKSNLTTFEYDGFYRLLKTRFPNPTGGGSSTTDFELLGYDNNSNVTSRQLRNANVIGNNYDHLNRLTSQTLPASPSNPAPTFQYDNLGRLTEADNSSSAYSSTISITRTYAGDGLHVVERSSLTSAGSVTTTSVYDAAGRLNLLYWPDSNYVQYAYDNVDEVTAIQENGATSGIGVLAIINYDNLGRRISLNRGNGTTSSYSYDGASNLTGLSLDLTGTVGDQSVTMGYNPAGQIVSRTASNDNYAWTGAVNGTKSYTTEGRNEYTNAAGVIPGYDSKQMMTYAGGPTYSFGVLGQLATVTIGSTVNRYRYDAEGRLIYPDADAVRLVYAGAHPIAEYALGGAILRRYVFGPGDDEPLVWYEGSTLTASRRFLAADERGSVISVSDASGSALYFNRYDEYGVPQSGNVGRFQYTGQQWHSDSQLYDYKARFYSPYLGRFMQTDPIGYANGLNIYNYVGSDPVNETDPSGLTNFLTGPPPPPTAQQATQGVGTGTSTTGVPFLDGGETTITANPWANTVTGPSQGQLYPAVYELHEDPAPTPDSIKAPRSPLVAQPKQPAKHAPPSKSRSLCAGGTIGGLTVGFIKGTIEAQMAKATAGEISAGEALEFFSGAATLEVTIPVTAVGLILAGAIYYYDQNNGNATADKIGCPK